MLNRRAERAAQAPERKAMASSRREWQGVRRKLWRAATSLGLILVVALGLRLTFLADYVRQNPRQALSVLPFLFETGNIAHSLATGGGFSSPFRVSTGPTAWMTPVYPLLLAGVFRVFGSYSFGAYLAAALLNILFVTAVCVPLFYIGKRIGGLGLGAGAAWLWAIFPNAILIPFESMWDASLDALLAAVVLWATLALGDSRRRRDWVGYGLLWGLVLMTNPTMASLLPLLLGWVAWRTYRRQREEAGTAAERETAAWKSAAVKKALARPTLALAVAMVCCVPWTVRNDEVFHQFVPLRSVLGLQVWLGNNPQANAFWRANLHPIYNQAEREKYIRMGELPYMREKLHEALTFMTTHPQREADLIWNRFVSIWAGGTPNPIEGFRQHQSLWYRYVLLFNLLAGVATLAGIVILFRRGSPYAFPLAVFPVVYPLAYYLTLAMPRYRLPIDPMVMLLGAMTVGSLVPQWAGGKKGPIPGATRAGRAAGSQPHTAGGR
jgi:4-amino-4-deoxy-L-arabinose transferase-like glycosyltransferase